MQVLLCKVEGPKNSHHEPLLICKWVLSSQSTERIKYENSTLRYSRPPKIV